LIRPFFLRCVAFGASAARLRAPALGPCSPPVDPR
jgi:hypothetical protein